MALSPDGAKLYVLNRTGGSPGGTSITRTRLFVIDVSTLSITAAIPVPSAYGPLALAPDGKQAYVLSGERDMRLIVVDLESQKVTSTIELGMPIASPDNAIAITPDGTFAYVAHDEQGALSIVDLQAGAVVTQFRTPDPYPQSIVFSPDGSLAYVGGESVYVMDTATRELVTTIPGYSDAEGARLAITPDGAWLYAYYCFERKINVIDAAERRVVSRIEFGEGPSPCPQGIAFLP